MLFSEPKIPQSKSASGSVRTAKGFSALQRAENSSILVIVDEIEQVLSFSALQRAENSSIEPVWSSGVPLVVGFSALQRAENSSIR